tara:strand:- start:3003 stop:3605 length:603 start_codon:yes stop_codon:yes gene_type:complete
MKDKLNIYSNNKIEKFLHSLFSKYDLIFRKLESIDYMAQKNQPNIIIINDKNERALINFKNLNDNYLIITCLKINKSNLNNKIQFLNTPIPINYLKNAILNFTQNLKIQYYDISIDNDKLINLKNNSFCYLTKVELEILKNLIKEKEISKAYIKENILNIKSNIETNSLESHLTRIRKKMIKVDTSVKIKTKSEKLSIIV